MPSLDDALVGGLWHCGGVLLHSWFLRVCNDFIRVGRLPPLVGCACSSLAAVDLMWLVGLLASSAMFPATLFALLLSMPGLLCGPLELSAAASGVAPSD